MSKGKISFNIGPGLTSMLTVAFIVLKLIGKITWSWWWVMSPLWISAALALVVFVVAFVFYVIASW